MNSVTRHLDSRNIVSTLITMRSGKKEVFLVVEGSADISLYSSLLGIPPSNFVNARGKERIDEVLKLAPTMGLDDGTIFIRDRDHDDVLTDLVSGVPVVITDLYDVEICLLRGRIFGRIVREYLFRESRADIVPEVYELVCSIAAPLGALRHIGSKSGVPLDFDGLEIRDFVSKTGQVDVHELCRKVIARSKLQIQPDKLAVDVGALMHQVPVESLMAGKDMLDALGFLLNRRYKCCDSAECNGNILAKVVRISATLQDLLPLQLYGALKQFIGCSQFKWSGIVLP